MSDLVKALIPVFIALISVGFSIYSLRVAQRREEIKAKQTKEEQLEALMSRYRDPLLRAAFDLQSRLFNILRLGFLDKYYSNGTAATHEYAEQSTQYVVAEYFGWVEILRRDVQFLDLGDVERDRALSEKLDAIGEAFLSDKRDMVFHVFKGQQRAIGELMIQTTTVAGHDARETLGFATFVSKLGQPEFGRWFEKLRADIELLATAPGKHEERLIMLQHGLLDLLDFLDPDFSRFPQPRRVRLEEQVSVSSDSSKGSTPAAADVIHPS